MKLLYGSLIFLLQKCVLCIITCGDTKYVTGEVGSEVILHVDNKTGIKDVAWSKGDTLIAQTFPNLTIDVRDESFGNRLHSTRNASLRIDNLEKSDQGNYTASVRNLEKKHCAQRYELEVHNKDPIAVHGSSQYLWLLLLLVPLIVGLVYVFKKMDLFTRTPQCIAI